MRPFILRLAACWLTAGLFGVGTLVAEETNTTSQPIDLPSALKLAGAQNLDVLLARQQLAEARAQHDQARMQFFPWIAPSVGYRRHEGNIQDVAGNIIETDKQSYNVGAALNAQFDLGDAIFKSLATKQLARASAEGAEAQRQESVFNAATGYFELSRAAASAASAQEAVRIAEDYAAQVGRAAETGIAFKGDVYRAQVRAEKNRMLLRQAQEQQRVASARLAQILRLPAAVELVPQEIELVPVNLGLTNAALGSLVARAFAARPELRQTGFLTEAAKAARKGAAIGPIIPTVSAQAYYGGLGGGVDNDTSHFDDSRDYFVGLNWRIGPGGLFDGSRIRGADAREKVAEIQGEKMRSEIERQVVEAHVRWQSQSDQLAMVRRALDAADQLLKLSQQRKEFGAAAVLETILAEQELTQTRLQYFEVLAAYDRAQFALSRAVGGFSGEK